MQIQLNVNDLVEQIVELTKHQNEAVKKIEDLSKELIEVRDKLMLLELEETKKRIDFERDLDQMAKDYEDSQLGDALTKIING